MGGSGGWEDIEKNEWFGNENRINAGNFNATALKLADKLNHPLSHLSIYENKFVQGHGFAAVTVTNSKYFVSLDKLDWEK